MRVLRTIAALICGVSIVWMCSCGTSRSGKPTTPHRPRSTEPVRTAGRGSQDTVKDELVWVARGNFEDGSSHKAAQALNNGGIPHFIYVDLGTYSIRVPARDRKRAIDILRKDSASRGYSLHFD